MRVDFSFSAVGGKRPPNILETRIVGKGRLDFSKSPLERLETCTSSASGKIVVEFDIVTPHPRTVRLTLRVLSARFEGSSTNYDSAELFVEVTKSEDGDGGEVGSCPVGETGSVSVTKATKFEAYVLRPRRSPSGITFESVEPKQPLGFQITVIAPGFRKDPPVHFPEQPSLSATYKFPIAASLANSAELTILIGFENAQVIYHYRK
jgi:hypothetical protein